MAKRPVEESKLLNAAEAFDDALTEYARLAELLLKTPLGTARQLERVNQTINEITATEERLGQTGRGLAEAVAEARERQQELAERMVAYVPEINRRNGELREIVTELQQIGEITRDLNVAAMGGTAAVLEVEEKVTTLAARAEALTKRAHEAGFEELGNQAHQIHQQLEAAARKLRTVTSRVS